jgi:hypothetical protein
MRVSSILTTGSNFIMTYERFSQLWDEILGDKIVTMDCSKETMTALIEYGQGNKEKLQKVKQILSDGV